MVTSTCLKILHSFLYKKYINHIHLLNFLYPASLVRVGEAKSKTFSSKIKEKQGNVLSPFLVHFTGSSAHDIRSEK
jgi:hypothetical protein